MPLLLAEIRLERHSIGLGLALEVGLVSIPVKSLGMDFEVARPVISCSPRVALGVFIILHLYYSNLSHF